MSHKKLLFLHIRLNKLNAIILERQMKRKNYERLSKGEPFLCRNVAYISLISFKDQWSIGFSSVITGFLKSTESLS